ncbi:helix-turn-helix domain-containing protein [Paenibacillus sp. J5C_2022]|uniref:helix-turn-helix domain-containing protein n=1 Tax=Paenibacillus sp. J5C2022 TaxID=2977129 RepID=UPI0021D2F236|nr:helix-turn-helix transcriptional regulator [Paenibacillus sp. J5C2022]MCU6709426.1 helix-turn-helix domain-containing protein [Paenibacillus sp. J5C2022]
MLEVKPRLTEILKQRGITQSKLSEMTGVPQSAISRFDRNTQHSDVHVFAIAKALGVNVEELFEITGE